MEGEGRKAGKHLWKGEEGRKEGRKTSVEGGGRMEGRETSVKRDEGRETFEEG